MKSLLSFFFLFLLCLTAQASPILAIKNESELLSYFRDSGFNGILSVSRGDQVLLEESIGYKSISQKRPLSATDRFQIGSVTKQFIATGILKLVEMGRLSLDDQAQKFLPELSKYEAIKVRNLLNHISGLKNFTEEEEFWKMSGEGKINSDDDIVKFALKFPLNFKPGTKFEYSNTNYVIAGRIIEVLSGLTWDKFLEVNFLSPLGMNQTSYAQRFTEVSDVVGHVKNDKGQYEVLEFFDLRWAGAAGGLSSNVQDLRKWCGIYSKSTLLSESSKKEMQSPVLEEFGFGVMIESRGKEVLISHGGRTPGFVTELGYLREQDLCLISLNNFDGNVKAMKSLLQFYTKGSASVLKSKPISVAPETLNEYLGTYIAGEFEFTYSIKNGRLMIFVKGQRSFELTPVDVDSFNLEGISGQEFLRNEKGEVTSLRHYQAGTVTLFNKKVEVQNNFRVGVR